MSRSLKKGPFIEPKLLKKMSLGKDTPIKTWSRASEISPEMVGFTFLVHNGKDFIEVRIHEDMIGHRLGEFSLTRKFTRHGGKMQKELEQKQTTAGTNIKK
ncbi:MAG: 30S ribosomal protein S19, partial [Patescibacteria group bacterium]